MQSTAGGRGTLWAFLALAVTWGASFLFMKLGLEGLSPSQLVVARLAFGAATLLAVMLVTRRRWPRELRVWGHMLVVGITFGVIPYTLFAWAEQSVPSGLASIYNATTPIMTLLLTPLLLRSERLRRTQAIGLAVGLLGVIVLVGPWQLAAQAGFAATVPGQLACLGATLCYGFSGLYMRRFLAGQPYDSVTLSTVEITLAALVALLLAPFDARGAIHLSVPVVLAMAALGILGTGIAYIWYTMILRAWGPAPTSTVTYLTPVVGVLLGVLLLGETVHWNEPVGGLVVIAGILVSQYGAGAIRMPRRRAPAESSVPPSPSPSPSTLPATGPSATTASAPGLAAPVPLASGSAAADSSAAEGVGR